MRDKRDAGFLIQDALCKVKDICEDRYKTYGDPLETYAAISTMTSVFLEIGKGPYEARGDISEEVAICLEIIKKLIRVQRNPAHLDSWDDIMGYAACGHAIAERKYGRS